MIEIDTWKPGLAGFERVLSCPYTCQRAGIIEVEDKYAAEVRAAWDAWWYTPDEQDGEEE